MSGGLRVQKRLLTRLIATTIVAASLSICVDRVNAQLVIGGFDATRSDVFSVPDGSDFTGLRTAITSNFPRASFVSFPTLTPNAPSGVQLLMIGAASSGVTTASALSATEQTVLFNYVVAGGSAIIQVDNDVYAGSLTSGINNSFLVPFGLDVTGTLNMDAQVANVTNFANPVIDGPFGLVLLFTSYFPGYFDSLGPNASSLAILAANGQPALAVIAPGCSVPTAAQ